MVIDVLADEYDGTVVNALVKYLSIDEVFGEVLDSLTEVLVKVLGPAMVDDVDIFDDPIILVAETMIVSSFVVSILYSRDVLGMSIEAVVETLFGAMITCVVGSLADVDANVLPANTSPLVFITESS